MPLILRTVEPKHVSQQIVTVKDNELEAVTNNTLANVLRQLASLVLLASDIFEGLAEGLQEVHHRSVSLKAAIERVDRKVAEFNPKTITVPESDICTFSQRTTHYHARQKAESGLFTAASRPDTIRQLYEAAAPTPVRTIRTLDQFRRDGSRSSKLFICTPVLQGRRKRWRKVDLDIETRKPSTQDDLRRWTSTEALGDVTVLPDNTITVDKQEDQVDHLLPSPEEQMLAIAMKFPPCIVPVDVSGRAFERLSSTRRSWNNIQVSAEAQPGSRRRRRKREKRRNTLAGTSHKEIEAAMAGEITTETEGTEFEPLAPLRASSGEIFKVKPTAAEQLRSQLHTLRQWSRGKLKAALTRPQADFSSSRPSFFSSDVVDDDIVVYGRVNVHTDKGGSSTSVDTSATNNIVVRLRENSLQRRNRRAGLSKTKDEPVHSSSGNWSASSESGRTSIASETTTAPKSTSSATSSNSLQPGHAPPSVQSRRRMLASGSSSVSEGTLTPDIHDFDGETSSVYSCDTEGYYTSFHMDSGLKTLKEEDIGLSASSVRLNTEQVFPNFQPAVSTRAQMTAENEYELFGRGSTSTTTSSAGTVCTTLLAGHTLGSSRSLSGYAPAVPERKSSLDRKERTTMLIADSPSPDSGHNTSSSPGDSCEQVESDLEGARVERLRTKTAINSGRIPSMVAITPPASDEEIGPQAQLRIAIPDEYALPDKRRHNMKTISKNGILETNLDVYDENRPSLQNGYANTQGPLHYTVEREVLITPRKKSFEMKLPLHDVSADSSNNSDYVSLNAIPSSDSLERRRQGARVTLDTDGKVVYSSDSLKRKKGHSTFVPGKFVRESPTPSPVLGQRTPKPVRPVQTSGLIKTNGSGGSESNERRTFLSDLRRSVSPKVESKRSISPKIEPKRSISSESRRSISPKDDRKSPRLGKVFVRAATRVVSPGPGKKSPSSTLEHPKRNIQNLGQPPDCVSEEDKKRMLNMLAENPTRQQAEKTGRRPQVDTKAEVYLQRTSPSLKPVNTQMEKTGRQSEISKRGVSPAPSNSSTSSSSTKRSTEYEEGSKARWVSQHPSVPYQTASALQAASISPFPRNHPIYSTLPARPTPQSPPKDITRKSSTPTKPTDRMPDLTLSPIASPKPSMTSEELFAAIHRSKKRLNLKTNDIIKREPSPATSAKTSLHNFKMLLLQKGQKDNGKLSAVEQLRLSKDSKCSGVENSPLKSGRKNQWKFASPKSNVLSSTIHEDCDELERPEQTMTYVALESSPLLRRGREDYATAKPSRAFPSSNELDTVRKVEANYVAETSVDRTRNRDATESGLQERLLPDPPSYTNSLGRPKRLITNTYAKITGPLPRALSRPENTPTNQNSPTRTLQTDSVRKSLNYARKEFFSSTSPPITVPYGQQDFDRSRQANSNVPASVNSSALLPTFRGNGVRSLNASLETAL